MQGPGPWEDLTQPISSGMPYNPDHFPPEIKSYAAIETAGWEAAKLVLDSHLGTHLDAPRHFIVGGTGVDRVDLNILIGPARVVDLSGPTFDRCIDASDLPENLGQRTLLATGWTDEMLGSPSYFLNPPTLNLRAGEKLLSAGVRMVGIDGPTVDTDGEVHRLLLGNGCLIVEGLTNLASLGPTAEICVLPLLIRDADGSPVRAVGRRIPTAQH